MNITRLPDDIIRAILVWFKADTCASAVDWPDLLPLLAVCAQWRRVGVPVVYSSAFVVAGFSGGQVGGAGVARFYSNLELCASTQNTRCIRMLQIEATPVEATYSYLCSVERCYTGVNWSRVRSLTLRQLGYRPQSARPADMGRVSRFVGFISSRMPRICAFQSLILDDGPNGSSVGNQLADHYAHRLTNVKSLAPLALSIDSFSTELTRLQLTLGGASRLPLVCRDSLRQLSLCNVPHDYRWQPFESYRNDERMVFRSLQHLSIYYKLGDPEHDTMIMIHSAETERTAVLHFPALEELHLFRCYGRCQILASAMLPKKMATVHLHCSPAALPHMVSHELASVGRLDIDMEPGAITDPQLFLEYSNRLFGASCPAASSRLAIASVPDAIDVRLIMWTRLESLTIVYSLDANRLLLLLGGLPSLESLDVQSLDVTRFEPPPPSSTEWWPPRHTLRQATINAVDTRLCSKSYLAFIRMFAIAHVGLRRLGISPSVLSFAKTLTRVSGKKHPHLAHLTVESAKAAGLFQRR